MDFSISRTHNILISLCLTPLSALLCNAWPSVFIGGGIRSKRKEPSTFVRKSKNSCQLRLKSSTHATYGVQTHSDTVVKSNLDHLPLPRNKSNIIKPKYNDNIHDEIKDILFAI